MLYRLPGMYIYLHNSLLNTTCLVTIGDTAKIKVFTCWLHVPIHVQDLFRAFFISWNTQTIQRVSIPACNNVSTRTGRSTWQKLCPCARIVSCWNLHNMNMYRWPSKPHYSNALSVCAIKLPCGKSVYNLEECNTSMLMSITWVSLM